MKSIITLAFILLSLTAHSQCSTVSVQVSASDTNYVQLYNAGFFNIPSGFANVIEWEVRDFSGTLIHEETTSGAFEEQSSILFDHMVPITDSMKATIIITNEEEGIICTMNDTLFWEEIEVLPGSFIGNWGVLSSSGGVEENITTSTEQINLQQQVQVVPSLVSQDFWLVGRSGTYAVTVLDMDGRHISTTHSVRTAESIDVSDLEAGIYYVQVRDQNGVQLAVQKVVKQ